MSKLVRIMALKYAYTLIPGTHERPYYFAWQRNYENVIKGMGPRW